MAMGWEALPKAERNPTRAREGNSGLARPRKRGRILKGARAAELRRARAPQAASLGARLEGSWVGRCCQANLANYKRRKLKLAKNAMPLTGYSSVGRASDCRCCRNQMVPGSIPGGRTVTKRSTTLGRLVGRNCWLPVYLVKIWLAPLLSDRSAPSNNGNVEQAFGQHFAKS